MNKYNQVFAPVMSSKQVTMLYFKLYDEAKKNGTLKELESAHKNAWEAATKRENLEWDKAREEGYMLCAD